MANFESFLQDIRYAFRSFSRSRLLTAAVVATLIVGIGLNAAIFAVVNGMMFRPRIRRNPQTFVQILPAVAWKASLSEYYAFRSAKSVRNVQAWSIAHTIIDKDLSDNLSMVVTCGFFSLYDLAIPKMGRVFRANDCDGFGVPVVVIGEELWRRQFASDAGIVGRSVMLNQRAYTVIGVVPADFEGRLRGGGIWLPYKEADNKGTASLTVEGRLAPGYSRSEALAELTRIARGDVILTNGSMVQHPGSRAVANWVAPLVLGAFGLILLLACTNVTMLLLSRGAARQREMWMRRALGAEPRRLARMLLTEGLVLAALAGIPSALLTFGVPAVFERVMWRAPHYNVQPDWLVFTYLAGLILLAGTVAGLAPAAEMFRFRLSSRTRDVLICAQVATSLVLLMGASLFARAQFSMLRSDPGFSTSHVIAVAALGQRLDEIPGVRSVCHASAAPFSGKSMESVTVRNVEAAVIAFSPGCFQTLGIPIVRGNGALSGESIVVSRKLAARLWPGEDPVGKIAGRKWRVAGVAEDIGYLKIGSLDGPTIYRARGNESSPGFLLIRFDGDGDAIARSLSRAGATPSILSAAIPEMASRFAVIESVVVVLGILALALALVGIFGAVGFAVLRRTKELGVRLALGASTADLVGCVIRPGIKSVAMGIVLGGLLALAGSTGLQRIFLNSPVSLKVFDPLPYLMVPAALCFAAVAAMLVPALRAALGTPARSLRED